MVLKLIMSINSMVVAILQKYYTIFDKDDVWNIKKNRFSDDIIVKDI